MDDQLTSPSLMRSQMSGLLQQAEGLIETQSFGEAIPILENALRIAKDLGEWMPIAKVAVMAGKVYRVANAWQKASELYELAKTTVPAQLWLEAEVHGLETEYTEQLDSEAEAQPPNLDEESAFAKQIFAEMEEYDRANLQRGFGMLRQDALLSFFGRSFSDVHTRVNRALHFAEEAGLGDTYYCARVLSMMGSLYMLQGQFAEALPYLEKAHNILIELSLQGPAGILLERVDVQIGVCRTLE
jgi:tetratricopeptide (TPR) repeat protein